MILLDTHIWIRWNNGDSSLPKKIAERIRTASEVAVSAISVWEFAYLVKRGQLKLDLAILEWIHLALIESEISCIPITADIAHRAALLPNHHRDPADRFIIATALETGAELASMDEMFLSYKELEGKLISERYGI